MNNKYKFQIIALLCLVILASFISYKGLKKANQFSNKLMLECSEADTLRGGEGYAKEGFFDNYGLPDICYGERFTGYGQDWHTFQSKEIQAALGSAHVDEKTINEMMPVRNPGDQCVYTHYPQGSFIMTGISSVICGVDGLACIRLFPTISGILATFFFAWLLYLAMGNVKSVLIMLAIAYVPISYVLMPSLYYSSYAHSLLIIQLAILLNIFRNDKSLTKWHFIALFVLGVLQGMFSYDFCFLVTFAAVPFAFLYSDMNKKDMKRLFLAVLIPGLGFCTAHGIHLLQVIAYYGNLSAFLQDFSYTASYRFDDTAGGASFIHGRLQLISKYIFLYANKRGFFNISLPMLYIGIFALSCFREIKFVLPGSSKYSMVWAPSLRNFFCVISGFIVSFLWIIVMKQHSTHVFITLHLFMAYFFVVLTAVESISFEKQLSEEQSPA